MKWNVCGYFGNYKRFFSPLILNVYFKNNHIIWLKCYIKFVITREHFYRHFFSKFHFFKCKTLALLDLVWIIGRLLIADALTTDEAILRGDLGDWILIFSMWLAANASRFLLLDAETGARPVEQDDLFFRIERGELLDLSDLLWDATVDRCNFWACDGFKLTFWPDRK